MANIFIHIVYSYLFDDTVNNVLYGRPIESRGCTSLLVLFSVTETSDFRNNASIVI